MTSYWDDFDDLEEPELPIPTPNQLFLAGRPVPGLVELPEGEIGRSLDKKNGPGLDGATQTWQGYDPPEIKLTVRMWRASHRQAWRHLLAEIMPRPGKPPATPFAVYHEALLDYGITQVAITKVGLPRPGKSQGEVEVTLTVSQWTGAPKKVGTSTPKTAAVGAPTTVHELKGGHPPALIGPPAPPVPPSNFNPQPS